MAPVGGGEVEAVGCQVRDARAQARQCAAMHAPASLWQAALQSQPPQAVQLLEGG